jgi:Bacterial sugar transferase
VAVRPGITGLAQVQLPPDTDLDSVRRKLAHDLYYIREFSFWLDLRILLGTALNLLGLPASITRRLLALPGGDKVEQSYQNLVAEALPVPQAQAV